MLPWVNGLSWDTSNSSQVSNFDGVVLEIVIWSQRILKQNKHKSYTPMWAENRHSDFGDQWEIGPE